MAYGNPPEDVTFKFHRSLVTLRMNGLTENITYRRYTQRRMD